MATILVADDDAHIREVVVFALERAGHASLVAKDGEEALVLARTHHPDLIVLDVGMPGRDGLEVCRTIRANERLGDLPVLFLSARDEEVDRIVGLEMGGDDYVPKPFSPRELVARVAAILRRGRASDPLDDPVYREGRLLYDTGRAIVRLGDESVALTANEMSILGVLMARPGRVFERGSIIDLAYGGRIHVSDRTVDSHVRNMRAKFAAHGADDVIETVHGLGFRLGPCESVADADEANRP